MRKAKFIVIDGIDGSGKTTQWYLLAKKLRAEKISYQMVNFPIYQSFFGKLIKRYLKGDFGDPIKTNSYFSALPYALDRFFYKEKLDKALRTKKAVLVNRYMTSNLIYQGAKIKNLKEREKFFKWEEKLEYDLLNLPKPDLVIYLWVPPEISFRLIAARQKKVKNKKRDRYEKNLAYQSEVAKISKNLAKKRKNWQMIKCYERGILLSRQEIAKRVWEIVKMKIR
ncbi:MAG: dTMP kinase [Patescibacteria group bacterium]